jgi:hypothetical protein
MCFLDDDGDEKNNDVYNRHGNLRCKIVYLSEELLKVLPSPRFFLVSWCVYTSALKHVRHKQQQNGYLTTRCHIPTP